METAYLVLDTFAMPSSGATFPRAPHCPGDCGYIAYRSDRAEPVS